MAICKASVKKWAQLDADLNMAGLERESIETLRRESVAVLRRELVATLM